MIIGAAIPATTFRHETLPVPARPFLRVRVPAFELPFSPSDVSGKFGGSLI